MDPRYTIASARPRDLQGLAAIELAAASLLRGHAPASVLNEATGEREFREAQTDGRLWVALADDTPVGFALIEMLAPDLPHLEEIDVHPQHGRRGIGTALVRAVFEWVHRSGHREITLTTFRSVSWNMPFYARLGFEEVPPDELRPELAAVVLDETARGLDPTRRVVMRYRAHAAQPRTAPTELPNVAGILGRVLQHVPREQQPLLIAVAERMAADRYRGWAGECSDASRRSQLLACAAREEEIARRVEDLYPEAAAHQRRLMAENPDLEDVNRSLFAGRPLEQQFTIQALGERLGAATWRSFAEHAENPEVRQTFVACAQLEEESAVVLESLLGRHG